MIFVISPAKALDFDTPSTTDRFSQPDYLTEASELISTLRTFSPHEIAKLMSLSDQLAALNVARYESWSPPFSASNAKQAVLAFNGDVYAGLDAASLSGDDLAWAQGHLRILSGLYGLLRPLDLIQAYRLEMGSRLANDKGRNLYAFWGDKLTEGLNSILDSEREAGEAPVLVNLASEEYFKAVRSAKLRARVVTPVFEDWKGGSYKTISFYAKRARGLMVRYAIQKRARGEDDLKGFNLDGYAFAIEQSEQDRLVFRRRLDQA